MKSKCLLSVAFFAFVSAPGTQSVFAADELNFRGTVEDQPNAGSSVEMVVEKSNNDVPEFLKRHLVKKLKRSEPRTVAAASRQPAAKPRAKKALREPSQILVKEVSLQVSAAQLAGLKRNLEKGEREIAEVPVVTGLAQQSAPNVQVVSLGNDEPDIYTATLKAIEPTEDLYTGSLPTAQAPTDMLYDTADPAKSNNGQVTDIASAAHLARENSNLVKAFDEDANAAAAGVKKEEMGFLPTVSNTLAYNYEKDDSGDKGPNSYNELAFNWPIYTGGQRRHALASAQATLESAEARRDATEGRVIGEVVDAYLRYVFATRIVGLLKQTEVGASRVLESVNAQRAGGFASGSDVQSVRIELSNVRSQIADAETNLSRARDDVALLAGRPVQPRLDVNKIERALSEGREVLLKKALHKNPRIKAAIKDYESAQESARSKAGRGMPQVAASGNYRYDLDNRFEQTREEWNIGARMTIPLLDLATRQDSKQAAYSANAAYYRALETKRVIANEFSTQWVEYLGATRELQQADKRIAERRKLVEAAKSRFDEGAGSLTEYLRSLGELKAAQITAEQTRARHVSNMARLLLTVGDFDTVFPSR